MADHSAIEWTDATWNPITGCSVVSAGCKNCYAMRLAGGRLQDHASRQGLTEATSAGPVWTGEVRLNEQWLDQPLRWRRPRNIFVCAHSDLFHANVPDEWIDRIFGVMAMAPQHRFQILTKRPVRMPLYFGWNNRLARIVYHARGYARTHADDVIASHLSLPLPNVWVGVSVENQKWADRRVPFLLKTPAAVRFVSYEPALGPVDFGANLSALDWVIMGGESGPGARPMHPSWVRATRDACALVRVPFFFKQWGAWAPVGVGSDWVTQPNYDRHRWIRGDGLTRGSDATPLITREDIARERKGLPPEDWKLMLDVGKVVAGKKIDHRTHDAMPADAIMRRKPPTNVVQLGGQ